MQTGLKLTQHCVVGLVPLQGWCGIVMLPARTQIRLLNSTVAFGKSLPVPQSSHL